MATYLPGSNVQSDAMQTLYFMNPSYAGYTDASNPGNMVLISPSVGVGHTNPLTNSSQNQHHQFFSFPLPPTLAQNSLAQHSALTDTPTSNIGQHNPPVLFPNQVINHIYNWTGGDELSFIPSADAAHVSHHSSVNSGQQSSVSDISLYGLSHQSVAALHEQQASLLQRDIELGLNVDNTQAAAGAGHGLSLSLSPQQPPAIQVPAFHMQLAEPGMSNGAELTHVAEGSTGDRFPDKWTRSLSSFRASSRDRILGSGYQNTSDAGCVKQSLLEISASVRAAPNGLFTGSKYLKVAQLLLDEVVSVGRGFKSNLTKQTKMQAWIEPTSTFNASFVRGRIPSENPVKDGISSVPVIVPPIPKHINDSVLGLTQAERQELQMKKAKLIAMLAEVDQRYKQYYNQMQIVVTSFESAAGLGAAKTYTALALRAISRQFRSLRDAIRSQLRVISKAIGEDDALPQMKGETSRLQLVDQQLCQQRALQQIGMMQQHAWRPQRGLPERSVSILRAWLFEHFLHPYPKDADKLVLARQAGLTRSQVSNWFINARVRLWKPMVEEMYQEETKEASMEAAGAMTEKKMQDDAENLSRSTNANDGTRGSVSHEGEGMQTRTEARNEGTQEKQNVPDHTAEMLNGRSPSVKMASCISDSDGQFSHENSLRQGALKKPRHAIQESASLVSHNTSIDVDIKSEETRSGDMRENDKQLSQEDRHSRDNYHFSHNGRAGLGGLGSIQGLGGMNRRYSQEIPTAARYSGSSSVSLTLGLQHQFCDGISLSGPEKHYVYGHSQESGRRQDGAGETESYYRHHLHENSAAHSTNLSATTHDTILIPHRKRFAAQL